MKVSEYIDASVNKAVKSTITNLKKEKLVKNTSLNNFSKVEKILYLYPKLDSEDTMRMHIDKAMRSIRYDEYFEIIESYYFNGMTFEEIAIKYGKERRTISRQRVKLIRKLVDELMPNKVIQEILDL